MAFAFEKSRNVTASRSVRPLRSNRFVHEIDATGLRPGHLFELFRQGVKVVYLRGDGRVKTLWDSLVGTDSANANSAASERHFWENSVFTLATNHTAGQTLLGDMLRFVPGEFGHIARKFVTYPDLATGRMRLLPNQLLDDRGPVLFEDETLRSAWELCAAINRSALLPQHSADACAAAINLLKYPDSAKQLHSMFALMHDEGSRWTDLGRRIDHAKTIASGLFGKRYVRDLYAIASLLPGPGDWLQNLNERLSSDFAEIGDDEVVVGPAHIDSSRSLTMLASDRHSMKTEFFDGEKWHELPLTTDSLAIMPSGAYDRRLPILPTRHRYTIKTTMPRHDEPSMNVTMLLGVMPRPFQKDILSARLRY